MHVSTLTIPKTQPSEQSENSASTLLLCSEWESSLCVSATILQYHKCRNCHKRDFMWWDIVHLFFISLLVYFMNRTYSLSHTHQTYILYEIPILNCIFFCDYFHFSVHFFSSFFWHKLLITLEFDSLRFAAKLFVESFFCNICIIYTLLSAIG